MKKIILLIIWVLLLNSANIFAQGTIMTLGSVAAGKGASIDLPVNVTNFNDVGAISLKIYYDTTALSFLGIANSPSNAAFNNNATDGNLILGWFDATVSSPINISNGKLLDLLFKSNGNTGSVNFAASVCEISDETGKALPVTYIDGGVTSPSAINLTVKNGMPAVYKLYQNYPNPFNPGTLINYALPFTSNVKIEIYNIAGERVGELVNAQMKAGYYSVSFNTTGLTGGVSSKSRYASGIYLYSIYAKSLDGKSEYSNTMKMVYLK
jgi:hypothetical protein